MYIRLKILQHLLLILFVSGVVSYSEIDGTWDDDRIYNYQLTGTSLTAIHQLSYQYVGISVKGNVQIKKTSNNQLFVKVSQLKYAKVHQNLTDGWNSLTDDKKLIYQNLIPDQPMFVNFTKGSVSDIAVNGNLKVWEVNILKSIISLLQIDIRGAKAIKTTTNQIPIDEPPVGFFKTNEDTVTGKCITTYTVSPLPSYIVQSTPYLVPQPTVKGNDYKFFQVVKYKNFSDCVNNPRYHFGFAHDKIYKPGTTRMGNLMARSSVSRATFTGKPDNNTLQSSVTVDQVVVSPYLYNTKHGIVATRMNLTLVSVKRSSDSHQVSITNSKKYFDLVYDFNPASSNPFVKSSAISSKEKETERNNSSSVSSSSSNSRPDDSSSSSSSSSSDSTESDISSGSSSFDSSNEEDYQTQPNINEPPHAAMEPHFIGVEGNSIQASPKVNITSIVKKLASQIGYEIMNNNSVSFQNTMSKFTLLTNVVETMNVKQMQEVVDHLYTNKTQINYESSKENQYTWEAYLHALVSAGTGSSFQTIINMIENNQLEGEKAAQAVAQLSYTSKFPNEEYMERFFSFIQSPVVKKQQFLNATAVITFAELYRFAQVSHSSAHIRFPDVRTGPKHTEPMNEKYISYLEQNMKNAIAAGDSHKAQIYIHALGNTGHPKMLAVCKDYIEGEKLTTQFIRLHMISNFYHLAQVHPHLVQPVLLQIFQNVSEIPDIRTAAVNLIMYTYPSAELLQMLAMSTKTEISNDVRSALKSAIESAAENAYPVHKETARNAQAARYFLTDKDFGQSTSKNYYFSVTADDEFVTYESRLAYIRSRDHYLPSSVFLNLKPIYGGIHQDPFYFAAMTSSAGKLFGKFREYFVYKNRKPYDSTHDSYKTFNFNQWSVKNIIEQLGIKIPKEPGIEANFLFEYFGGKRMFAVGNETVQLVPQMIQDAIKHIKSSPSFELISMRNQNKNQLGFPTSMGLPFTYSLTTPTIIHTEGKVSFKTEPDISSGSNDYIHVPQHANISLDIHATYACQMDSKFGFVTPFDHHQHYSGVVKNFEINAAFKAEFNIDSENCEVNVHFGASSNKNKHVLFHYSTVPYTSSYDLINFSPALEQSGTYRIHVKKPKQINFEFGKSTGVAFNYEVVSEDHFADEYFFDFNIFDFNRATKLPFPIVKRGVHPNNVSLIYDPSRSSVDSAKFSFTYKNKYTRSSSTRSQSGFYNASYEEAIPSTFDSKDRPREFLDRVSAEIPDSNAHVVDVSIQFEKSGQTEHLWVATFSAARNDVSPKSNTLFYFGINPGNSTEKLSGSYEMCISSKAHIPQVPELYMYDAIKANPNTSFYNSFAFGSSCRSGYHFDAELLLTQSSDYKEKFTEDRMVQLCEEHIKKGDDLSYACQSATINALKFDKFTLYVNYKRKLNGNEIYDKDNPAVENALFPISIWLNRFNINYLYQHKRSQEAIPKDKYKVAVQIAPEMDYINITLFDNNKQIEFNNAYFQNPKLPIRPYYIISRLINAIHLSRFEYLNAPHCSISKKFIHTFDNITYEVSLKNDWYVAFIHTPKFIYPEINLDEKDEVDHYKHKSVAVYVKKFSYGKEVKVVLDDCLIEMMPKSSGAGGNNTDPAVSVIINGNYQSFSSSNSKGVTSSDGEIVANIFAKPNGEITVYSHYYGFKIVYYHENVKIYAEPYYTSYVRGLCGNNDGYKYNDFTTPRDSILASPEQFIETYAFSAEESSKIKENRAEAVNPFFNQESLRNRDKEVEQSSSKNDYNFGKLMTTSDEVKSSNYLPDYQFENNDTDNSNKFESSTNPSHYQSKNENTNAPKNLESSTYLVDYRSENMKFDASSKSESSTYSPDYQSKNENTNAPKNLESSTYPANYRFENNDTDNSNKFESSSNPSHYQSKNENTNAPKNLESSTYPANYHFENNDTDNSNKFESSTNAFHYQSKNENTNAPKNLESSTYLVDYRSENMKFDASSKSESSTYSPDYQSEKKYVDTSNKIKLTTYPNRESKNIYSDERVTIPSNGCRDSEYRIRYIGDKICVSLQPYPVCYGHRKCFSRNWHTIEANFYCEHRADKYIQFLKNLVDKGGHINFRERRYDMRLHINVPLECHTFLQNYKPGVIGNILSSIRH